ncbi:MAG: c-type cytochrome [Bdellovibrionales bacterium]
MDIIASNCSGCHGASGQGGVSQIKDVAHLIQSGLIVPGDSSQGRLIGSIEDGSMPPSGGVSSADLQTLKNWVDSFQLVSGADPLPEPEPAIPLEPTFKSIQANILIPKCVGCHRVGGERPRENYESYSQTISTGKVVPGSPGESEMYKEIISGDMPRQPYSLLTNDEIDVLRQWIAMGALDN